MKREGRRSTNVEDRRGIGGPAVAGGGVGVLVLALVIYFLGGDPEVILQNQGPSPPAITSEESDELADFVRVVLADTEDVWREELPAQLGQQYREPTLVLFTDAVDSQCGIAGAAVGPFYCPLDEKVYIDLSFYRVLKEQLDAPGDFAQAYVIAHEVGHHIQNITGVMAEVRAAQQRVTPSEANALSVSQELQADCLAGVWAHHAHRTRAILEPGDIEEALGAASAIGDDTLQRRSQGAVVPETFTHGTSAQRVASFRAGFETGDVQRCNTFQASR
jgi:uncharacterized protein